MIWVFDAYGTLFDVDGAAREAAKHDETLAEIWPAFSADWRRKQLEYSWMRAITGVHADFWQVTSEALEWAAERHAISATQSDRLLELYRNLPAFPEVPEVLARLQQSGCKTAIFSNGSPQMLADAVGSAGLDRLLDVLLSVESCGHFKPSADSYRIVTDHFSCAASEINFASSNGWDIYGAAQFGFRTNWVNRSGLPVDRLPSAPGKIVSNLRELE